MQLANDRAINLTYLDLYDSNPTSRLITDIIRTQCLLQREAYEREIMNKPVERALRPKMHGSDATDLNLYAMGRGCGKTPRWAEPEALEDPFPNAHRPRFTSGGFCSLEDSDCPDFGSWWSRPTTPRYFKPHSMSSRWLEQMDNILSNYLNPKFLSISHLKNNKFDMKNFNCGDTVFFFVPMQAAPKVGSGVIKAKRTAETLDGKMEIEYDIDGTKLEDEKVFKTKEALLATL